MQTPANPMWYEPPDVDECPECGAELSNVIEGLCDDCGVEIFDSGPDPDEQLDAQREREYDQKVES